MKMETDICYFNEEVKKNIPKMFGRSLEEAEEDIVTIKEWIKSQPHLPEVMEDARIRNFLIQNKFSIEKTKEKVDLYYTVRSLMPDFFEDSNPKSQKMQEAMKTTICCLHPKPYKDLYKVFFFKLNKPNSFDPRLVFYQAFNIGEVRMVEDCVFGEICVIDMKYASLTDIGKLSPILISKLFTLYGVYSLRLQALYFINSPSYISTLLLILKSILKPKIFDRIQVHHDAEILTTLFDKKDLLKDYGGDGPSLEQLQQLVKEKLSQYQARFDLLDTLRVDESLRPTKLNNDEILGFYGNFKKLNVD